MEKMVIILIIIQFRIANLCTKNGDEYYVF